MGLFSKESCAFCGTEVGALKRSKLATKEFICNDCKRKTNYFARMSYTSRDAAQRMMDTLGQEAADFEASFDAAEGRFARAERSFNTWDLGSKRVHYRCNTTTGAFQINMSEMSRYEHMPVFWFDRMLPYEFKSEGDFFSDMRRSEVMDAGADYVEVDVTKGDDGKVIHCMLTIPYDDACIREIKLNLTQTMQHLSMIWPTESTATAEHGWARPSLIWSGRTVCRCAIWEIRQPQR